MDVTSAILYLRSRETLQLQHVVHVEEVTACEHSHLKSPSRNKSDDSPFTMATSLYDIRLVLPFLQLVFQHSGNRDIKIFTMKPRRVMAIYHLYINLLPQYGHISDTIKIIQLLLENYPTQRLETILGGKTIRTMQTQYIQKLGIQCFSQPLHWRWLVANILLYLKASEVAKLCTTVTTGTKNKHKQHNPKRMQTPSSVFRSGSIFSKKKEVDSYNINRVSTPL